MTMIDIKDVCIVFGAQPDLALPLMDQGMERPDIQTETGQILGVHNCNLQVDEGEIVVLMGLSGSGKSTLLRGVNGLNPITRGALLVNNGDHMVDLAGANDRTIRNLRRNRVSMVFQKFGLLPWRSVVENVAFGLEVSGMPAADRRARAMEELEVVGLTDWADNKLSELSGGMQQRVGLARAFATDAPILLMDEPFSALDPLIRAKLQDDLLELQAKTKRTILFVSHDLEEAIKIGNRIAIMEGGRIVQTGTPEDIILRPADDYVAEFVAHINPLPVITAMDCMATTPAPDGAAQINAEARAETIAAALSANDNTRLAVMQNGVQIGSLAARDVLQRLTSKA